MNNNNNHHHKSPCRYYKEYQNNGEYAIGYCTAVTPMLNVPECDMGTESYCVNGKYEPTNMYREITSGMVVFALDINSPDYQLIAEGF